MVTQEEVQRFDTYFPLIRRTTGWSAEMLGERIGISRQAVNNIENKKYKLTKTLYIAMRYVLDEEIRTHKEETEMLKLVIDAFVDNPDKYSEEAKKSIYSKVNLLSQAIKPKSKSTNRG